MVRGLQEGDDFSATMLDSLLEVSEAFPLTGSLKFGSHPFGPLMQHAADIAEVVSGNDMIKRDLLPKALKGDKKALMAIGELLGKSFGFVGTSQIAKTTRGLMRGESLPRAAIGRLGAPKKKRKSGGRKSRKGRSKR